MTWPEGSSEMAQRVRNFDWTATSLGPIEGWPQILRHTVDLLLVHPLPMALLWGPDLIHIYNDDFARLLAPQHPSLGRPAHEQWGEATHLVKPIYDRVLNGEAVRLEDAAYPNVRGGTIRDRWYMVAHSPVRGADGQVAGILISAWDKTTEKIAERRLRETEEKQSFLLRLSDALRPLADAVQVQQTAMQLVNERFDAFSSVYFELGPDGDLIVSAEGVYDRVMTLPGVHRISDFGTWLTQEYALGRPVVVNDCETDPRLDAKGRAAFRAAHSPAMACIPLCKGGRLVAGMGISLARPRSWSENDLHLLEDVAERTWDAVERARAEAALRGSEERLRMLVAELQHRVRNILTVVRSVFSRTIESGGGRDDNADHFRGRLDALARTQVIVTQTLEGTVDLENLIRDELISVGVRDGPGVQIGGPDVLLSSRVAESLGLAIHELTTNALKYGALKMGGAQLSISWTVHQPPDSPDRLDLCWQEQGVPAIPLSPTREGFGRELIEEALPYRLGAETSLDFKGGGVRCFISVPLTSG
jgi:two-component sensor histidine kinase